MVLLQLCIVPSPLKNIVIFFFIIMMWWRRYPIFPVPLNSPPLTLRNSIRISGAALSELSSPTVLVALNPT